MKVEVIYASEQVLRFKISAGQKEMVMEKLLLKKTNPWKIPSMNFKFATDDKTAAMSVMYIQDEIDYQLKTRY